MRGSNANRWNSASFIPQLLGQTVPIVRGEARLHRLVAYGLPSVASCLVDETLVEGIDRVGSQRLLLDFKGHFSLRNKDFQFLQTGCFAF